MVVKPTLELLPAVRFCEVRKNNANGVAHVAGVKAREGALLQTDHKSLMEHSRDRAPHLFSSELPEITLSWCTLPN
jgi:hypothetical protein